MYLIVLWHYLFFFFSNGIGLQTLSVLGRDIIGVLNYTKSSENFDSSNSIFLDEKKSYYNFSSCFTEEGNFIQNLLSKEQEDINPIIIFDKIYSNITRRRKQYNFQKPDNQYLISIKKSSEKLNTYHLSSTFSLIGYDLINYLLEQINILSNPDPTGLDYSKPHDIWVSTYSNCKKEFPYHQGDIDDIDTSNKCLLVSDWLPEKRSDQIKKRYFNLFNDGGKISNEILKYLTSLNDTVNDSKNVLDKLIEYNKIIEEKLKESLHEILSLFKII